MNKLIRSSSSWTPTVPVTTNSESLLTNCFGEPPALGRPQEQAIAFRMRDNLQVKALGQPLGAYVAAVPIHAAMQADAMLDAGDLDGAAVWRRIVTAINELLADAPAGDASVH